MDSHTAFSLPSLMCEEDESSLNEVNVFDFDSCFISKSEDDEYVHYLIQRESKSDSDRCICDDEMSKKWFKSARLKAINWIFNTREMLGLHFHTAYLSLTYFDRFNSRIFIDIGAVWAVQLLSIACLSLAAKMEEQSVPLLSHYKAQEYNFESSVIYRMELMVMFTLEWEMCSITPFVYLHHFFSKVCDQCDSIKLDELLISRAIGLILDLSKEVNLMDHRPSVIAIAAVLSACDGQITSSTVEFKISVVSSLHNLEKDCIYSCYNQLKEIKTKKNTTPESTISFRLYPSPSSTISTMRTKRKLTFNDFEQHCSLQKTNKRF